MVYQLNLLQAGKMVVPGSEVFWMRDFKKDYDLTLWIGVIRGNGKVILVNTGCPESLADLYGMTDLPEGGIEGALGTLGVRTVDVTDVVVTPFQAYALGYLDKFNNATIHLSKTGWIDFHAPKRRRHPHDIRERCIPPHILKYLVIDAWDRVRLLENEDDIADGIPVFWTGSHHRSSVAVQVDTRKGVAILSDAMFYEENVTQMQPIGINESMEECLSAYERIQETADCIVPLYDPRVRDRYALLKNIRV